MSNWREQLWLKIIALTISGVFLFSEVTWAARANFAFSLPQNRLESNTAPQGSWRDGLWQIYQQISSFLIPSAHAEVTPYDKDSYRALPENSYYSQTD